MTNHPSHQIIRTAAELEALDPETLLIDIAGGSYRAGEAIILGGAYHEYVDDLPAIILMDADQVRASRAALDDAS